MLPTVWTDEIQTNEHRGMHELNGLHKINPRSIRRFDYDHTRNTLLHVSKYPHLLSRYTSIARFVLGLNEHERKFVITLLGGEDAGNISIYIYIYIYIYIKMWITTY